MSLYSATIVYGWKGVCSSVPAPWCTITGLNIFAESISGNIGNMPIYGCECSIQDGTIVISNKQLVDDAYEKIIEYCTKEHIVPPVMGIYPAIQGSIEWHSTRFASYLVKI
jgi:hypothetical protein